MATYPDPSGGVVVSTVGRRGLPWWVWAAIVIFILLVVLWLASVLMQPGLRQAVISGNEASAIGYVRAVASAEQLAAQFNKGYFLPLSCLTDPAQCPPAVASLPLLSGTLTDSYSTYFVVMEAATPEEIAAKGLSANSAKTWTLVVLPRQPGVTGTRVFCTDTSGGIFYTPDDKTLPDTTGGRCGNASPLQ